MFIFSPKARIKKIALYIVTLFFITACLAQRDSGEVWASKCWKTREGKDFCLCKDIVHLNRKGFIITSSGCEQDCSFTIDYYTLKADTILVRPYSYMDEPPFLEVRKTRSRKPMQQIAFWCADGKPASFLEDSLVRFFGPKRSHWPMAEQNSFSIPRYLSTGIEIMPLSKTFNIPIVFWLDPKYDYRIMVNIPFHAFVLAQSCKKVNGIAGNLGLPYLLMKDNKIMFPSGNELPIERY